MSQQHQPLKESAMQSLQEADRYIQETNALIQEIRTNTRNNEHERATLQARESMAIRDLIQSFHAHAHNTLKHWQDLS